MGTTKTIEKSALAEMFSPSVSPSAARDAEIKKSVELELSNVSPETSIPASVMVDEIEETQPSTAVEPPTLQRRVSGKQRRLSLEEYRSTYLKVPVIIDRKPVFVSCEIRDRLEDYVRKQVALAEQARLKEQAAKEQESKAKSIKAKQEQPKDNPNKKSKP